MSKIQDFANTITRKEFESRLVVPEDSYSSEVVFKISSNSGYLCPRDLDETLEELEIRCEEMNQRSLSGLPCKECWMNAVKDIKFKEN